MGGRDGGGEREGKEGRERGRERGRECRLCRLSSATLIFDLVVCACGLGSVHNSLVVVSVS